MCCSVLQCVAVCCSELQYVAVCCSMLQCAAVCYSVLRCAAVCCREFDGYLKCVWDVQLVLYNNLFCKWAKKKILLLGTASTRMCTAQERACTRAQAHTWTESLAHVHTCSRILKIHLSTLHRTTPLCTALQRSATRCTVNITNFAITNRATRITRTP